MVKKLNYYDKTFTMKQITKFNILYNNFKKELV